MSDKPTQQANWATDGAADVIEPIAAKKDIGWTEEERPPGQYMNWWQRQVHRWVEWWDDGFLRRSAIADRTPVLSTCDRDGRERHTIGPEGFLMGPAVQRLYEADGTETVIGPAINTILHSGLKANATSADTVAGTATELNQNSPIHYVEIKSTVAGAQDVHLGRLDHSDVDDLCAVAEFRGNLSAVGVNNVDAFIGWDSAIGGPVPVADRHAAFVKKSADTDWQWSYADGAFQDTGTTAVTPIAGTNQTFRLEYHGANTPVGIDNGTAPVVRFFIDGALVKEGSGSQVPSGPGGLTFIVAMSTSGAPASDRRLNFHPLKYAYNQVLDGDVPV